MTRKVFVLCADSAGSDSRCSETLWRGAGVLCNWHVYLRFFGIVTSSCQAADSVQH